MEIVNTGVVAVPDIPESWQRVSNLRVMVTAIEEGMPDKVAWNWGLMRDAPRELEVARAVHGMKALKRRRRVPRKEKHR